MSCEYESYCLNRDKCYRCFDQGLLKLSDDKKRSKPGSTKTPRLGLTSAKDSWKKLESDTAEVISKVPTIKEARRSRASGALWFEKGDVVDDILHPEAKERTGRLLVSGDQSMSIQRSWLEKAKEEVRGTEKTMCLPFSFKGDEVHYVILDLEDLGTLVGTLKAYQHDNDVLRAKLSKLKLDDEEGG